MEVRTSTRRLGPWFGGSTGSSIVSMLMRNPGHGVNVDMYDQFFSLTQELITLGHTRIALAVNAVDYWPVHRRIRGFVDACRAAGIDAPEIATIMPSRKAGAWLEQRL